MDADAALEQGQDLFDLRQLAVVLGQDLHGVLEHLVDQLLLVGRVEVELGHL